MPRLLRFRLRSLARRLGAGRPAVAIASLVVLAAALVGLAVAGRAIAALDAGSPDAVYGRVFWIGAISATVWGYTSFESLFRAPDRRFLANLPIPGRARFTDLFLRALLLHAPLVLPALAYGLGLAAAGAPGLGAYAAVSVTALYVAGLPLSMAFHMWAGRSLLSPSSELKRWLAGAAFAEEAALLVYAPAAGLLVTLALGVFADFAWRDVFVRQHTGNLAPLCAAALGIGAAAFIVGRRIADEAFHRIMPRFAEVDLPLPYNEDGLPKRTAGEGLARRLPPRARAYFLRDLRQLRRRHRVDRLLLWAFGAALLRALHAGHGPTSATVTALAALAFVNGVFLASAFRLHGAELASPSLELTMPVDRRAEALGRFTATLIHPLWTVGLATAAVLTTGAIGSALATLGLGLALVLALVALAHALARLDARTAWPYRLSILALVGLVGGWL